MNEDIDRIVSELLVPLGFKRAHHKHGWFERMLAEVDASSRLEDELPFWARREFLWG